MSDFNAHREAVVAERDRLARELSQMEATPGTTLYEYRVAQRKLEQLEHQLIWYDRAPKHWFKD